MVCASLLLLDTRPAVSSPGRHHSAIWNPDPASSLLDLVNIFCLNSCVSKHLHSKSISSLVKRFFTKIKPCFLNANFIWDVTENTSPCDSKVAASIPTPGHSPTQGQVDTEIVFKNP